MEKLKLISILTTLTVILVIIALVENSLAVKSPGRKFNCKKCRTLCKGGNAWGALATFCARCQSVCGSPKTKNDPWLKISMMKKQIRNGTDPAIATLEAKVPGTIAGQQGRALTDEASESPIDETGQSGMGWWGRR